MALSVHIKKKLKDFELVVDFDMEEGIVGFLGSSGCGKSMTLKCIAGIETPDEGSIVLDGEVLFDKKAGIDLSPQKRKVGYLFQNYALFPHMTVRQNIEAGLEASGKSKQEKKDIVERLLEQFHIKELENLQNEAREGQIDINNLKEKNIPVMETAECIIRVLEMEV